MDRFNALPPAAQKLAVVLYRPPVRLESVKIGDDRAARRLVDLLRRPKPPLDDPS